MTRPCRSCGVMTDVTPQHIRRGDYRCWPCRRQAKRDWRAQRRAQGLDTHYRNPAKLATWAAGYYQRPEVKQHRATNQRGYRQTPAERPKMQARKAVQEALAAGRIQRQPCAQCGNPQAQAHHADYTKRLEVTWLRSQCHTPLHRGGA
jgi:hypothetical protein